MKKVVSFSLFGSSPTYLFGAIQNAMRIGNAYFPGWISRFYFSNTVPNEVRSALLSLGAELFYVDLGSCPSPIFGRLLVMMDASVDTWICREAESRPSRRDEIMVNDWLDSGLPWHVIKDHSGCAMHPVYTGCFGGRGLKALVPGISDMMFAWARHQIKPINWTEDKPGWFFHNQEFVRDSLWPSMLKDGVRIHWSRRAKEANRMFPHFTESDARASRVPPRFSKSSEPAYIGEAFGCDEKPLLPDLRGSQ
jgi:hypothetical protein